MITKDLSRAIQTLKNNELVAIPTETVYGLAGNAYSEKAIRKIFELKNRPLNNPLIVHIKSINVLDEIASEISDSAYKLAEKFWPGPLTLVLKKKSHISDLVTAGQNTIAVRVPNHPLTSELLENLEFPLVAPSANPFTFISPTSPEHVLSYFKESLLILDGGSCSEGIESTIIGFESDKPILYRYGSISIDEIEQVLGKIKIQTKVKKSEIVPGMFKRHYSPRTKTIITEDVTGIPEKFKGKNIGLILFQNNIQNNNFIHQEILSKKGDLKEAAKNLYSSLHRLDLANLDLIIIEKLPNKGIGISLNDRIKKAAHQELNYIDN